MNYPVKNFLAFYQAENVIYEIGRMGKRVSLRLCISFAKLQPLY